MRVIRPIPLMVVALPWLLASSGWALAAVEQATPGHPVKTVKQCNEELRKNEAALEAAGESASAFFHRCWWHSEEGKPTPIAHGETVAPPVGENGAAKQKARSDAGREEHRQTARRRASRHMPSTRREARALRRERSFRSDEREDIATVPPVTVVVPAASRTLSQVNVYVPVVGSVAVPVLPGLEGTVRAVVEHPVVPGLITASP